VDCEGWDVFSVLRGDHLLREEQPVKKANFEETVRQNKEIVLEDIRKFLREKQPGMARQAHLEARQFVPGWVMPEQELAALIEMLMQRAAWNEAVELMVEYLRHHRQRATTIRVYLARVCLEQLDRPMQALKVLAKLDFAQLSAEARPAVERLRQVALSRVEQNPYDVVHDDW
jgi:hypothetical protein